MSFSWRFVRGWFYLNGRLHNCTSPKFKHHVIFFLQTSQVEIEFSVPFFEIPLGNKRPLGGGLLPMLSINAKSAIVVTTLFFASYLIVPKLVQHFLPRVRERHQGRGKWRHNMCEKNSCYSNFLFGFKHSTIIQNCMCNFENLTNLLVSTICFVYFVKYIQFWWLFTFIYKVHCYDVQKMGFFKWCFRITSCPQSN